jgi:hypothetical protein
MAQSPDAADSVAPAPDLFVRLALCAIAASAREEKEV